MISKGFRIVALKNPTLQTISWEGFYQA